MPELSREEVRAFVAGLMGSGNSTPQRRANMEQMKEALRAFDNQYGFKIGDLVQWKPGFKNAIHPKYGEPIIVAEILDGSTDPGKDSGTLYYLNKLDLGCLVFLEDGTYGLLAYDSRYLMPYPAGTKE